VGVFGADRFDFCHDSVPCLRGQEMAQPVLRRRLSAGGALVKSCPFVGPLTPKALSQKFCEQVVIAETGFRLVGRHNIKIPAIQIFESAEGIAASGQTVADLGTNGRDGVRGQPIWLRPTK